MGINAVHCCAGQFGTRLQGGKDAAGARYIMTRLDKIARVVFHEHDDKLLGYLKEEGQSIEPQWCASALCTLDIHYIKGLLLQACPDVTAETGSFPSIPLEPEPCKAMQRSLLTLKAATACAGHMLHIERHSCPLCTTWHSGHQHCPEHPQL